MAASRPSSNLARSTDTRPALRLLARSGGATIARMPGRPLPAIPDATRELHAWLESYRSVFVLTGAGVSTNSGIPEIRSRFHKSETLVLRRQ